MKEKQLGIRLPEDKHKALMRLAKNKGTNATNLIRPYIYELLKKEKENKIKAEVLP